MLKNIITIVVEFFSFSNFLHCTLYPDIYQIGNTLRLLSFQSESSASGTELRLPSACILPFIMHIHQKRARPYKIMCNRQYVLYETITTIEVRPHKIRFIRQCILYYYSSCNNPYSYKFILLYVFGLKKYKSNSEFNEYALMKGIHIICFLWVTQD